MKPYERRRKEALERDGAYLDRLKEIRGFNRDRGIMDCGWCVCFLIFVGAMSFLTYYSYHNGNVWKLVAPVDGDFRICGFDTGVEDYPYLYLSKMDSLSTSKIFKSGICVKSCPRNNKTPLVCKTTHGVANCNANKATRYESINVMKFCMPRHVNHLPKSMHLAYNAAKT
jgi:hypothetical protein